MTDPTVRLVQREREVLDFEREWTGRSGGKVDAVRSRFGVSATRYYQLLNRAIDRPEAARYDPLLVKRLRRRRDERARQRSARRLGRSERG